MKSKKVILDTNIWIHFLISKKLTAFDDLIASKKITLIFSIELIEEFVSVVKRPKFKKLFSQRDIERLLEVFDQFAKLVTVTSKVELCRDQKDNFLLNLAIDSKADFLITGDSDLLVLEKVKKTKILTYQEFLSKIKKE